MPKRKHYPKHIDLKVTNEPNAFRTRKRYKVAQVLQKYWDPDEHIIGDYPKLYKKEYDETVSRAYFTEVYKDYFGPDDGSDWTFGEIDEEFEEYDDYIRYRDRQQAREEGKEEGRDEIIEELMQYIGDDRDYSPEEIMAFYHGSKFATEQIIQNGGEVPDSLKQLLN